ncbi:cyclic nucleotide-binding-like protein [Lipomyces oligophaga]|uniref:cyclic nucleotide-binding-like protein n=1 Tax=Lipomyces oligophaga TaxID=45792 RepID=UPI0034CFD94F
MSIPSEQASARDPTQTGGHPFTSFSFQTPSTFTAGSTSTPGTTSQERHPTSFYDTVHPPDSVPSTGEALTRSLLPVIPADGAPDSPTPSTYDQGTDPLVSSSSASSSVSSASTALPPSSTSRSSSGTGAGTETLTRLSTLPLNFNTNRRTSVSGESLSPTISTSGGSNSFRFRTVAKSPEQLERLERIIAQNFLFRDLDNEALTTILNVLEEKRVPANVTVIQQGDEGEKFYVVESGSVDYYVDGDKVSSTGSGSSFGELALMYNSPRAATVITASPCVFWVLDGTTFRRILMERTASKRATYEGFLREVPVLQSLTDWERAKIADALKAVNYSEGDEIVREGDRGEHFYLIEHGTAEVSKEGEGVVNKLQRGDYFGELALLNDAPRAATVTATTAVRALTLDKSGFQRLVGSKVVMSSY